MPNTFDPDAYLASQATKQSPQNIAPQNAAQIGGMQKPDTGFDPDAYLASKTGGKIEMPTPMIEPSMGSGAIDSGGLAFAQNFTNAIVPQAMVDRLAASAQGPMTPEIQAAIDANNEKFQQNINEHPVQALLGTGLGVVASGVIGNGIGNAVEPMVAKGLAALGASKVSQAAATGFTDLALLSTEAGLFSVLNDNPNTFEDAAKSFAKGASIAGALGLGLKGLAGANDFLTSGAKARNLKEVELAQRKVGVMNEAVSRAETMAARNAAEMDLVQSQLNRKQALLAAEPEINERVSLLPNKINDAMDQHIANTHQKVLEKVNTYKDVAIDPIKNFQATIDSLEAVKARTPQAIAARDSAIQFTKSLMSEAYASGGNPQDVLIGAYRSPKATVDRLYKQNSQFGDLLYNRDFMKDAPSEVQAALRKLQKSNRDLVASVDPTGELSQYMDFEHNLLNAKQRDGFTLDAPDFFKSYAANKDDPSVMARWRKFERNLMPREEVAQKFGKSEAFDAGFKPETMQNPELQQKAKNIRALINAEVEPATKDYAILNQSKRDVPRLQARITQLQNQAELATYKAETRGLAKERSLFQLQQKKMDEPSNAIEALLPSKLRVALHLRKNVNDSIEALSSVGSAYENNPGLQNSLLALQKGVPAAKMLGKGAARGLATRVPSLMGFTNSNSGGQP